MDKRMFMGLAGGLIIYVTGLASGYIIREVSCLEETRSATAVSEVLPPAPKTTQVDPFWGNDPMLDFLLPIPPSDNLSEKELKDLELYNQQLDKDIKELEDMIKQFEKEIEQREYNSKVIKV